MHHLLEVIIELQCKKLLNEHHTYRVGRGWEVCDIWNMYNSVGLSTFSETLRGRTSGIILVARLTEVDVPGVDVQSLGNESGL